MSDQFARCLALTLGWEGGFVDDPADPGGATCYGVTLAVYRGWAEDPSLGVADIRDISPDAVSAIYSTNFWNATRADAMPPGVDLMLFDEAVNTGCSRSVRILQTALGFQSQQIDGCVGPATIQAARQSDSRHLVGAVHDRQAAYYRGLSTFARFGAGWLRRAAQRQNAALAMASAMAEA